MNHPAPSASGEAPLQQCTGCRQPFVMPVALLDIVDEGLFLLALHCRNCDLLTVGIHEDAALEAFDEALESSRNQVRESMETLKLARQVEELDAFVRALEAGLVLPEDF